MPNSCCHREGQIVKIHLIGRSGTQARMGSLAVVEFEIPTNRRPGFADRTVGAQVDLLVFDRTPQTLDYDIVEPGPSAIHADRYSRALQHAGEGDARELTALIGIEDLWLAVARQCLFQGLDAERDIHRDRHPPGKNLAAEPVHDGHEVNETPRHGDVADVGRPDLVGPGDRQLAQQIGINLVSGCRLRRVRPAVDRIDRHPLHQAGNPQPADHKALLAQQVAKHLAARKRIIQMQLVHAAHNRLSRSNRQIDGARGLGQVVDAAPADPQRPGLPRNRGAERDSG